MRLAFSGEARHPDLSGGYELYVRRSRIRECLDWDTYRRVVKEYCRVLAERLEKDGIADLPCGIGAVAAVTIRRKPLYHGKKFIGYGKMDWKVGYFDGSTTAFGIAFLPDRSANQNLRCYGFVANRKLFKRMKGKYDAGMNNWCPVEFNDEMI